MVMAGPICPPQQSGKKLVPPVLVVRGGGGGTERRNGRGLAACAAVHFSFAAAAVAQRIKELSNRTCGGIGTLETPSTAAAASSLRASDAQFHVMWTRPGQLVRAIPSGYARAQAGIARPCATLPFPVIMLTLSYIVCTCTGNRPSAVISRTFRLHLGFVVIV